MDAQEDDPFVSTSGEEAGGREIEQESERIAGTGEFTWSNSLIAVLRILIDPFCPIPLHLYRVIIRQP